MTEAQKQELLTLVMGWVKELQSVDHLTRLQSPSWACQFEQELENLVEDWVDVG